MQTKVAEIPVLKDQLSSLKRQLVEYEEKITSLALQFEKVNVDNGRLRSSLIAIQEWFVKGHFLMEDVAEKILLATPPKNEQSKTLEEGTTRPGG
jgi:hypothetical protein